MFHMPEIRQVTKKHWNTQHFLVNLKKRQKKSTWNVCICQNKALKQVRRVVQGRQVIIHMDFLYVGFLSCSNTIKIETAK